MFSLSYVWAEIRRRKGRTVLTALGLAGAAGGLRAARLRPADALRHRADPGGG